jgi:NADPH2:quinone reductase
MQAIRQHTFGGPEVLQLETVPDPHPDQGQVRIKVQAAGVHLIDTSIRQGRTGGPFPPPALPMIPGREVAGVVDEVGPDVDPSLIGSSVAADLGLQGGYAELALAPASALFALGSELEPETGVAVIGTGATALAILDLATVRPDDVVLVTAAAGGIGTLLVQAAQAAGATVVGVAGGPEKIALISSLGAAVSVDYTAPSWPNAVTDALTGRPVTLVLDGVGGQIGRAAMELLGIGGRLVMFGTASGPPTEISARDFYQRGITVSAAIGARTANPMHLNALRADAFTAARKGELVPVIGQRFPLAEAAAAHRAVEARQTTGKTVLIPG